MGTSQNLDAGVDRLLRAELAREPRATADGCPDASGLAAFLEGNLNASERIVMEAHLAGCARCQEAVAIVALELPSEVGEDAAAPQESGWFTWVTRPRLRWLVPISAVATVAVVFFATRPLIAPERRAASTRFERTAELPSEFTTPQEPSKQAMAAQTAPERADELARGKRDAKPEAEMLASRVATEEKAAPPSAAEPAPALPAAAPPTPTPAAPTAAQMAVVQDVAAPAGAQTAVAPRQDRPAAGADTASKEAVADKQRAIPVAGAAAMREELRAMERTASVEAATDGAVRWVLGPGGQIWRTVDAGSIWKQQVSGVSISLVAGSAPSATTCWAVGAAGTVLLTTDGERWERRPFPLTVDLIAVEASSSRTAIVTTRDGRRFETLDAGRTWSQKQP